ncbi:hypothetical protein ACRZ9H_004848, partial [Escherichia coli O51:H10]
ITNLLETDMQSRVTSYRELARKAVRTDDSHGGIVAALERFFHKLEFLLKYGYLPSTEDIDYRRLPSEIQGLKAFLENGKTEDSYVLQRNDTERYRFSWQGQYALTVIMEKKEIHLPQLAGTETWRTDTLTENVNVYSMQSLLLEYEEPIPNLFDDGSW